MAFQFSSVAVLLAVEVVEVLIHVFGGDVFHLVESFGVGDTREHHSLNVGLVASAYAVAQQFGVLSWTVAAPVGHFSVGSVAHENHAVASFLVVAFHVVTTDNGTTVAAFLFIFVPENFHEVALHGVLPHGIGSPFIVGEVCFRFRLFVAQRFRSTIGGKTVTGFQLMNEYSD